MATARFFVMQFLPRFRPLKIIFDLLLIFAGFLLALFIYRILLQGGLTPGELLAAAAISTVTFWVAVQFQDTRGNGFTETFLEQFCLGTGANLLLHAVLTYAFFLRRTPFMIAIGGLFAAAFLTLGRNWILDKEASESRIVILGFDSIARKIAGVLRPPILGVVGAEASLLPMGISSLGRVSAFSRILEDCRPTHLVVSMEDWSSQVSPTLLLNCRLAGMIVEESPAVYERLFQRVSCERLQPMDLLLSSSLRGDSRTMAIQAVYTNLLGLLFLALLSPVLVIVSVAVALFSGPGPVLDRVECAGFRYIPFRLLRFRTRRRDGSDTMTPVGRILSRLRLVNLPHLINVVRGEMALVGPHPVRREFAYYLTDLMPFYSHRFSVKPGIVGWAQMHVPERIMPRSECLRIEYDLYYIKEGSPWLDAQILISMLLTGGRAKDTEGSAEHSGTAPLPC
jgi:lipopolysaccharide/colanic/teichoic acid biosynthesis glycosyltransferase